MKSAARTAWTAEGVVVVALAVAAMVEGNSDSTTIFAIFCIISVMVWASGEYGKGKK